MFLRIFTHMKINYSNYSLLVCLAIMVRFMQTICLAVIVSFMLTIC
jgi:hypothetical protein